MDRATFLKTLKIFGTLTIVITLVGYLFGNMLELFLEPAPAPGETVGAVTTPEETGEPDTVEAGIEPIIPVEEVADPETFYLIQLGIFSSLTNAATLRGSLSDLGLAGDVIRLDGNFMLYSQVVGSRGQLAAVEQILADNDIDYFIRQERAPSDDLGWQYFLMAANGLPFEIDAALMESFSNANDMHIFGFYQVLGSTSFEPLSEERQDMLMAIYNWLNS